MALNIFAAGVNTSFSTQLNQNFSGNQNAIMKSISLLPHFMGSATEQNLIKGLNTKVLQDDFENDYSTVTNMTYLNKSYLSTSSGAFSITSVPYYLATSSNQAFGFVDYEILGIYDRCNNSLVNTSLWTSSGTAGWGETTSYLRVSATNATGSSYAISNDLSAYKQLEFIFNHSIAAGNGNTCTSKIQISDGTNHVDILSYAGNYNTTNSTNHVILYIDTANDYVYSNVSYEYYYQPGAGGTNTYDRIINKFTRHNVSALSSLKLRIVATSIVSGTSGLINSDLYGLYYSKTPTSTVDIEMTNNGTDYESIANGMTNTFSTTGDLVKLKVSGVMSSDEVLVVNRIILGD